MKKRPMSAEEIRRLTEELKEICKPGDRVELISPVDDPFDRIKPGDREPSKVLTIRVRFMCRGVTAAWLDLFLGWIILRLLEAPEI